MLTYLGALLEERFGLSTGEIGLVYMIGGSGYFAGSLAAGSPLARLPARPLVAVSNALVAALTAWSSARCSTRRRRLPRS